MTLIRILHDTYNVVSRFPYCSKAEYIRFPNVILCVFLMCVIMIIVIQFSVILLLFTLLSVIQHIFYMLSVILLSVLDELQSAKYLSA
jgi:hypothetical protein